MSPEGVPGAAHKLKHKLALHLSLFKVLASALSHPKHTICNHKESYFFQIDG